MADGKRIAIALGVSLGVSGYYALLFLPLVPVALIGILMYGLGLLALAPLLSVSANWQFFSRLRGTARNVRALVGGAVVGVGLLLGAEAYPVANDVWINWATSADVDERVRGIELLRRWGDRAHLLDASYGARRTSPGLARFFHKTVMGRASTDESRRVFYRVYGKAFDAEKSSVRRRGRGWDGYQGGDTVGGRLEKLHLASSRLDGSVDADTAVGYLEWTLEFRNDHDFVSAEARTEIALPTGGVVSRATLWVDGEEREAAFAGAGEARQAYQRVVQRRRDPLLVTQASPGRVLVQCFPIQPNDTMKVRIGITFPLVPESGSETAFGLPHFSGRNFNIASDLIHHVWIESDGGLRADGVSLSARRAEPYGLRGKITTDGLRAALLRSKWGGARSSTAKDGSHWTVHQNFERRQTPGPSHLVVVVDTSASTTMLADELEDRMAELADGIPLTLVFTGDGGPSEVAFPSGADARGIREAFSARDFAGGRDNAEALALGVERAIERQASEVLWLHGPQPTSFTSAAGISQVFERAKVVPTIVPFELAPGDNLVEHELARDVAIERPAMRGGPMAELAHHFGKYGAEQLVAVRSNLENEPLSLFPEPPSTGVTAGAAASGSGSHLVRLWAADYVRGECDGLPRADCVKLAATHQLVTPLSGAVVLENQQQYDEAGLTAVDPATVPTIPEPETWLLICVLMLALLALYWREQQGVVVGRVLR